MASVQPPAPRRPNRPTSVLGLIGTLLDAYLSGQAGWRQALQVVFLAAALTSIVVVACLVLRSGLPW
ncbi:hypothetical protein [Nocardia sp. MH4]|uniref:hypothetical protein n=1 Tax=Nocardia sp. MH4 TaxID=1768677 RepID=UPI001C5013F5|nr:hypothetical protein [Nocardia sp. MH4]